MNRVNTNSKTISAIGTGCAFLESLDRLYLFRRASMSIRRKLHELHEKHENLWWILLAIVAVVGLLVFASKVVGW